MRIPLAALVLLCPSVALADSTLTTLGGELAKGLGATLQGGRPPAVACGVVRASESVRGEELSRRACRVIAAKLPGSQLLEDAQTMQSAWKRAGSASRVAFVELELGHGELRASLDVHERATNVWERLKGNKPAPVAHAAASAPIDAEVRGFLPPLSLEDTKLHSYKLGGFNVLAMACGSFGTEPGNRLALLTDRELLIGRLLGKAFTPERRAAVSAFGPRTPVPVRPPLANVAATGAWERPLAVGQSDRPAVVLDRALLPVQSLRGIPFAMGSSLYCAPIDAAQGGYLGKPNACAEPAPAGKRELFDTLAFAELIGRDGVSTQAFAARDPGGKLMLEVGPARSLTEAVGAQVALADLDQDGVLEVVYALDTNAADPAQRADAVVISTFDGRALRVRKRLPTKAPVTSVAVCPADGSGPLATVATVGDEVWVVR